MVPGSRLIQVIRRRGVARLLLPTLFGRIPDSIAVTGIVILLRSATGSYPAAGLAAAAYGLGTAVCAPVAGRALDRLGQRRVLPALAAAYAGASAAFLTAGGAALAGTAVGVLLRSKLRADFARGRVTVRSPGSASG